jgi:LDH2 family malate/lactate/ureidoglycolate dehydrogenase
VSSHRIPADSLRKFVEQAFVRAGYTVKQAVEAADVLMWASLRGVDTHGVRNLKSFYIDRTLSGELNPSAQIRVEHETQSSACLDGDSGLGLVCACHAMRMAIEKADASGVGMVTVRNTHHLGPAGYYAQMPIERGMLGACMTGRFFGEGHPKLGLAPLGTFLPMFSTNPVSFAAPCGRHPTFLLDMSTSIATVNRLEMHAHDDRTIPAGWACDSNGDSTCDPSAARFLLPLGGTAELGGYKGSGLAMMVSILTGVLSGAWARAESASTDVEQGPSKLSMFAQPTAGHWFAAVRVDAFQPLETFRAAMDAMVDALKAAPTTDPSQQLQYAGEREFETAARRTNEGIPVNARTFQDIQALTEMWGLTIQVL